MCLKQFILSFAGNQISTIDNSTWEGTYATIIDLSSNELTTFPTFTDLQYLEELDLSDNNILSIQLYTEYPHLKVLYLRNNGLEIFKTISDFTPELASLDLSNNLIEVLVLNTLVDLQHLNISNNRINDPVNDFRLPRRLETLDVSYNSFDEFPELGAMFLYINTETKDPKGLLQSLEQAFEYKIGTVCKLMTNMHFSHVSTPFLILPMTSTFLTL